jgi:hypothetical protein
MYLVPRMVGKIRMKKPEDDSRIYKAYRCIQKLKYLALLGIFRLMRNLNFAPLQLRSKNENVNKLKKKTTQE